MIAVQAPPRVIGTAGHVDHGKSTLIKALTGIDPDRLQEEKERGMTIDLGFAWLRLPGGQEVSIVDVPGHERFIHNMLAGVGGIDLALLVIAADEGIMPQTREHLAILDLLGIRHGVVALTKADLVDQEWLDFVQVEVEEALRRTSLAGAPIVAVSAVTGAGLDALLQALQSRLSAERSRPTSGMARLPIDRVFTVAGFGTVVTGTLVDGELRLGQEVEVQPGGLRTRVRGLQTHKRKVELVPAGSRAAVNLSGVSTEHLRRGQVLTAPGALQPTAVVDARLRLVADLARPLGHNALVTFHAGTAEATARVRLLDAPELKPGQSGWVQIALAEPLALAKGDLFIVRQPSPSLTLGGGMVVEPHPRRHRRFQDAVVRQLEVLERGSPEEVLLEHLRAREPTDLEALARRAGATITELRPTLVALLERGAALALGSAEGLGPRTILISRLGWDRLAGQAATLLRTFHQTNPLRRGMLKEELRGRLGLDPRTFPRVVAALQTEGLLVEEGPLVRLATHAVVLTPEQERIAGRLRAVLQAAGASPPSRPELEAQVGAPSELVQALVDRGDLVEIAPDLVYPRATIELLRERLVAALRERGRITVAEVRDLFDTSRRYALPLLAYFDEQRLTRRVGDERTLY